MNNDDRCHMLALARNACWMGPVLPTTACGAVMAYFTALVMGVSSFARLGELASIIVAGGLAAVRCALGSTVHNGVRAD